MYIHILFVLALVFGVIEFSDCACDELYYQLVSSGTGIKTSMAVTIAFAFILIFAGLCASDFVYTELTGQTTRELIAALLHGI